MPICCFFSYWCCHVGKKGNSFSKTIVEVCLAFLCLLEWNCHDLRQLLSLNAYLIWAFQSPWCLWPLLKHLHYIYYMQKASFTNVYLKQGVTPNHKQHRDALMPLTVSNHSRGTVPLLPWHGKISWAPWQYESHHLQPEAEEERPIRLKMNIDILWPISQAPLDKETWIWWGWKADEEVSKVCKFWYM